MIVVTSRHEFATRKEAGAAAVFECAVQEGAFSRVFMLGSVAMALNEANHRSRASRDAVVDRQTPISGIGQMEPTRHRAIELLVTSPEILAHPLIGVEALP